MQADILGEDRYIAIRNENLKELAQRFGLDTEYIPDKIEYSTFTEEELKQLGDKYYQFFDEKLTDDMFSKEKEDKQTVVKLNMSAEKFLEIFSELMKTISEDEIINSKLPENSMQTFKDAVQDFQDDIEKQTYSEEDRFEMKIYIEKRQTKKMKIKFLEKDAEPMNIVVEFAENTMSLKCYEEGELLLEETISIQANENDVTYVINCKEYEGTDEELSEINIELTYKNLMQLDNVQEEFNIEMKQNNSNSYSSYYYDDYEDESTINIKYTNQKTFLQNLELDRLNETNAIILNDATDEEIQNVFYNIYESLGLM